MTTRRSFLGTVAGGLAVATGAHRLAHAGEGKKPPLGLQLWSLREHAAKDLPATLKQVKDWGIDETLSINKASNLSVQWCLVSESLTKSLHKKGCYTARAC